MRETGGGVVVEPGLCRAVARLAVLGLAELSRRDGTVRAVPGLASLLAQLDAASGNVPVTVDSTVPLTSTEAARIVGVTPRMARHLAATGRLIAVRRGRDWQISRQSAEDYARGRTR